MQMIVSGKHTDVGSALREYVQDNLEKGVKRYFENAIKGDVVFTKHGNFFLVEIKVNEGTGTGIVIKSSAEADDAHAAFDKALERIEKQLRRYKRRLKNHHHQSHSSVAEAISSLDVRKYIISSTEEESEADAEKDVPLVIAEKDTKIESMTVSEAVMVMDLAELPAVMFINRKNGTISVVYRRNDGNVSWIDSGMKAAKNKK